MASRIKDDNRVNFPNSEHPRRDFRHINKGLSMELLVALLLTWLDSAGQVDGGCCVRNGLPNNCSPWGKADIISEYPATEDTPAYQIVSEVSSKRQIQVDFYNDQLDSDVQARPGVGRNPGRRADLRPGHQRRSDCIKRHPASLLPEVSNGEIPGSGQPDPGAAAVHGGFREDHDDAFG